MIEAPGSFSDGFKMKVFPAAIASGHIHRGTIAGKLKGQMPATTWQTRQASMGHTDVSHSHLCLSLHIRVKGTRLTPRGCLML